MAQVWVLVADGSEARIYAARTMRARLELIETLTHEASRLHARDIGADTPGRVHDRFGPGRHSLDQGQQLKNSEKQRFARKIVERLAQGRHRGRFDRLVVMAGPEFLGMLRDCFDKSLAEAVVATVSKDLVAHDVTSIQAHLP